MNRDQERFLIKTYVFTGKEISSVYDFSVCKNMVIYQKLSGTIELILNNKVILSIEEKEKVKNFFLNNEYFAYLIKNKILIYKNYKKSISHIKYKLEKGEFIIEVIFLRNIMIIHGNIKVYFYKLDSNSLLYEFPAIIDSNIFLTKDYLLILSGKHMIIRQNMTGKILRKFRFKHNNKITVNSMLNKIIFCRNSNRIMLYDINTEKIDYLNGLNSEKEKIQYVISIGSFIYVISKSKFTEVHTIFIYMYISEMFRLKTNSVFNIRECSKILGTGDLMLTLSKNSNLKFYNLC